MGYFGTKQFLLKNNRTITLRDAEKTDAEHLIAFLKAITLDGEGQILEYLEFVPTLEDERHWVESTRANPNELLLTAFYDGKLIGVIDFHQEKRRRLYHAGHFGMGIIPEWRSAGLGFILLSNLLDWLEKFSDIELVQLAVLANNTRAIQLYQKLGFQSEGLRKKFIKYQNGSYVDELLMAKEIIR